MESLRFVNLLTFPFAKEERFFSATLLSPFYVSRGDGYLRHICQLIHHLTRFRLYYNFYQDT
jgi:hypothetical protein